MSEGTNKAAFTPGPWIAHTVSGGSRQLRWVETVDRRTVCHIPDTFEHPDDFTAQGIRAAEACLIASAPDLLKACKQALYLLKGREHDQFLRDAIAKAEGK